MLVSLIKQTTTKKHSKSILYSIEHFNLPVCMSEKCQSVQLYGFHANLFVNMWDVFRLNKQVD